MADRNVLGGELEPCGIDPLTGFFRDGCCRTGPEDLGSHTICAVVTSAFLEHQRCIGNDLITPIPQHHFPGLAPGDLGLPFNVFGRRPAVGEVVPVGNACSLRTAELRPVVVRMGC